MKKITYLITLSFIVFGLSLIYPQKSLAFVGCIGKSPVSNCTVGTPIQCSSSKPYTGVFCCDSVTSCTNQGAGYGPTDTNAAPTNGNTSGNINSDNTSNGGGIDVSKCKNGDVGIQTAIGCIHALSTPDQFFADILRWAVGIGGGIAFLLIIYAGFMIMTASGNPERLKAGQELLTSAISGLILLVFSIFILKFIGIDILGLDKFGFGK